MKVFRVCTAADAPSLDLIFPGESVGFDRFDGKPLARFSAKQAFAGRASGAPKNARQFYSVGAGALAIPEAAWMECEDLYYWCSMGSELLAVETKYGDFRVINPLEFLGKPSVGDAPCRIDQFRAPLFRIADRNSNELFCVAGLGVEGDQFKFVYEACGFAGLEFVEIWSSER